MGNRVVATCPTSGTRHFTACMPLNLRHTGSPAVDPGREETHGHGFAVVQRHPRRARGKERHKFFTGPRADTPYGSTTWLTDGWASRRLEPERGNHIPSGLIPLTGNTTKGNLPGMSDHPATYLRGLIQASVRVEKEILHSYPSVDPPGLTGYWRSTETLRHERPIMTLCPANRAWFQTNP